MQKFKKGQRVQIINFSSGGKFFVEGEATVIGLCGGDWDDSTYKVRFDDGSTVSRFIDPSAQEDVNAFVERLNSRS